MKIKLYNKIALCGTDRFPAAYAVGEDIEDADGIVVRSADLHGIGLGGNLRAIARAGAGVNNIPIDECTKNGVCVFNTPGANAEAVKELCIAALLLTSRRIEEGAEWTKTLAGDPDALKTVEKEKKRFEGPEIFGKTLGIIGLGAIGGGFALAASSLGMKVIGYDPFMPKEKASEFAGKVTLTENIDEVYENSDYISIHVPSLPTTKGMISAEKIAKMKDGARLLNLARADLISEEAVIAALESGKLSAYYTDFPTGAIAGAKNVVATPHLGASTPEAEDNCAVMACDELYDYLENGNVKNSVNFPALSLPRRKKNRISVVFADPENTEKALVPFLSGADKVSAVRGDTGYILAESDGEFELSGLKAVGGVLRVTAY